MQSRRNFIKKTAVVSAGIALAPELTFGINRSKEWLEKYDHPPWKKYGKIATGAGHGGMDFFVINAFVESAKQNIAPPLDAYDAAAWSAITPLSEDSIANNGEPQDFPDFTRGNWIKRKPLNWIKDDY